MLFHFLLTIIAASPFFIAAFPQADFVFDGPVATPSNGQRTTSTFTTTVASRNENSTTTTTPQSVNQYNACIISCPVTTEYNPVCGTDNVDYTNPGGLGCAGRCGKEVTLQYYGRCSTRTSG
ncbi:Kazal-like domain-containing protein [Camponotus japonicus]